MKTNLLSFCLSLIASSFISAAPIPPTPVGVPENIPFGKSIVTDAEASVCEGETMVYGNGLSQTSYVGFNFEPIDSSIELADVVRFYKPTVRVKNPLEPVYVRAALFDKTGKERLVAYTSYRHVVKRESDGRKTYVVPSYAGSLNYEVTEQSFSIDGAKSAIAVGADGNIFDLEVVDGVVKIPPFIASNPDYWNLVQVTLGNGQQVQYDGGGSRLHNLVDVLQTEYVGLQGVYRTYPTDGNRVELTFAPEYGWNPVIEFPNSQKQYVTIDLQSSTTKARPTYIRVYTLDQVRDGTKPAWTPYSPENVNYYNNQIEIPLEAGTYQIEMEWPTWLQYDSGGGKG
jgi:hypothetical protein